MSKKKELDDLLGQAVAGFLIGSILGLREAGQTPARAVSLASMALLESRYGEGIWELLGFPKPTKNRWKRHIKEAVDLIPDEVSTDLQRQLIDLEADKIKKELGQKDG